MKCPHNSHNVQVDLDVDHAAMAQWFQGMFVTMRLGSIGAVTVLSAL